MISVETLLVAILGGLGGGVIGTWLQIRHERQEAFRERMINAADDVATGLLQAIIGLEEAFSTCLDHGFINAQNQTTIRNPETGEMASETQAALRLSRELIAEAEARQARIALLFGPTSAPDRSVTLAVMGLEEGLRALDGYPVADFGAYSKEKAQARKYLREFNERALSEVKGRPWFARNRVAVWIRLWWRRRRREASK